MKAEFEWWDEYNIGVDVIDKEHRRLFKIINKLFAFREEEKELTEKEYRRLLALTEDYKTCVGEEEAT